MRHLLFFWFLLTGSLALGQTSVQITVTALPPFDPFLQDYFYQPGKLQVLVRNTTTSPLTIKLQASLSGDNGVEIATLPGYQPLQPLVLQPLQARYLTVADVKNMVDLSQVSVQGFDRSALLQGKALPEGEYRLCLQAIDLQTNRPLSPAETGCTRIPVRSVEPPILIAPLCDQDVKPQIPQNIVFTWAPPAGVLPSKIEYTLRIVELPLLEADPNVFIDAVVLPATGVEVKNLRINTFLYGPNQPALKPGRNYAWRVQARDPMGKLLFLNDGKSPVCSFQYGEIVLLSKKGNLPPNAGLTFTRPRIANDTISVGVNNPLSLGWKMDESLRQLMLKTFNITDDQQKPLLSQIAGNLNYILKIYRQYDNQLMIYRNLSTPYVFLDLEDLPAAMKPGPYYNNNSPIFRAEVTLAMPSHIGQKLNLPPDKWSISAKSGFKLVKRDVVVKDIMVLSGTLRYRYPGDNQAHPLPKTPVKLYYRQKIIVGQTTNTPVGPLAKPIINEIDLGPAIKTDAQGNYTITIEDFEKKTGSGQVATANLRLEVLNPYVEQPAELLPVPTQDKSAKLPDLTLLAKGYTLEVTAEKTYKGWPNVKDQDLDGQLVVVYRTGAYPTTPPVEGLVDRSKPDNVPAGQPAKPADNDEGGWADVTPDQARQDVAKAGYSYVAHGRLKLQGGKFVVRLDNLLYPSSNESYYMYCPNQNQGPKAGQWLNIALKPASTKMTPAKARVETLAFKISVNEAPTADFKGRLLYEFADPGQQGIRRPLANVRVRLVLVPVVAGTVNGNGVNKGLKAMQKSPNQSYKYPVGFNDGQLWQELGVTTTSADGTFQFPYGVSIAKDLKLGPFGTPGDFTGGGGEFYSQAEGQLYRTLRIIVDNPYYASPSDDFGDQPNERAVPLQSYNLGDLVAVAKSFQLDVTAVADKLQEYHTYSNYDQNGNDKKVSLDQAQAPGQGLPGVNLFVLRPIGFRKLNQYPDQQPPADEGQDSKATFKDESTGIEYAVISSILSNGDGLCQFPKLLLSSYGNDGYLVGASANATKQLNYTGKLLGANVSEVYSTYDNKKKEEQQYFGTYGLIFANEYGHSVRKINRILQPDKPSLNIRFVDKTNPVKGLPGVVVQINYMGEYLFFSNAGGGAPNKWGKGTKPVSYNLTSDQNGVIKVNDMLPSASGQAFLMSFRKDGYYWDTPDDNLGDGTTNIKAFPTLAMGTNIFIDKILLTPNAELSGLVRNFTADGSTSVAVDSYVQIGDGTVYETGTNGLSGAPLNADMFSIPVPMGASGKLTGKLRVIPKNVVYFPEDRDLSKALKSGKEFTVGLIKVFQVEHRIRFMVQDTDKNPIPNATAEIFGQTFTGGANGYVKANFQNVSISNLYMTVRADGYVTQTVAIPANDASRDYVNLPNVTLQKGRVITGMVVLNTNGTETPLVGAEVYIEAGAGAGANKTQSGVSPVKGAFMLTVPMSLNGSQLIRATYSNPQSGITYEGVALAFQMEEVGKFKLKLVITPFDKFKITSLWGFPIKITNIDDKKNPVLVSGELLTNYAHSAFRPSDPAVKLTFKNVPFGPSPKEPKVGQALITKVELNVTQLETIYSSENAPDAKPMYNVTLSGGSNALLAVVKPDEGDFGAIKAQARIVDNSFKFPSTLFDYQQGQFSLFTPTATGQKPAGVPHITAFNANVYGSSVQRTGFGLCQANGTPLSFSIVQFNATSAPDKSRLNGEEIVIAPDISCNIPNANPGQFTVSIGKLIIKNNTLPEQSGAGPLTFKLGGKWGIQANKWRLDYKQGGFYAENSAVVKTGKVDIPIAVLNLRHDMLFMKIDTNSLTQLPLGGVAMLDVGGKAYFGYDTKAGSDQKGHWSVVLVSKPGEAAATIKANTLEGLTSDITFEALSLLDNGEDVLSFGGKSQQVSVHDVVQFNPNTVDVGSDYFSLVGTMSTTVPRFPSSITTNLMYKKGAGGKAVLKLVFPQGFSFEARGYTTFATQKLPEVYVTPNLLVVRATVEEKGELGPIRAVLVHKTGPGGFTRITHDRDFGTDPAPLSTLGTANDLTPKPIATELRKVPIGGSKFMRNVFANMTVQNGDWGLLSFSGEMNDFPGMAVGKRMTFVVHGEIKADNEQAGLSDIDMGGAKMSLVYDFGLSAIIGNLVITKPIGLPGGMSMIGAAEVRFDPNGFYFALAGTVYDVPIIVPVTMKAGVLIGYYTDPTLGKARETVFTYTHKKDLPCAVQGQTFAGAFVIGEVPLPGGLGSFHKGIDLGLAAASVDADIYVDGYFFLVLQNKTVKVGGGASANLNVTATFAAPGISLGGALTYSGSMAAAGSYDVDKKILTMTTESLLVQSIGAKGCVGISPAEVCLGPVKVGFGLKLNAKLQVPGGPSASADFVLNPGDDTSTCKTTN